MHINFFLVFFIFLSSCSSWTKKTNKFDEEKILDGYSSYDKKDYSDQLRSIGFSLKELDGNKIQEFDKRSSQYLVKLTMNIMSRNEIFIKDTAEPRFRLIDSMLPIYFSLPGGEIYLSKGLITKYLKHESILAAILSYELLRSYKLIYNKNILIPTGYITTERLMSLMRLDVETKVELHKWAFHLMRRSGYDGEFYLSWLQIQNRNTADFFLLIGDANQMTREEALFKSFMIRETSQDYPIKKDSSKDFYAFINQARD